MTDAPDTTTASTATAAAGGRRARRGPARLGPRAELSSRPLHSPVPLVAVSLASLLSHAVLLSAWRTGVQAPDLQLASRSAAASRSAVHVEHTVMHIAQLAPPTQHTLIDDPPAEPEIEPVVTLLAEPEHEQVLPDVSWFDSTADSMAAFTIRARRPTPDLPDHTESQAPEFVAQVPTPPSPADEEAAPEAIQETEPAARGDSARVVAPHPASDNRPPRYPGSARRRGWVGRVILHVVVDASGAALAVEVTESSGRKILDQAALEAVRSWTFTPARDGNKAVVGETHVSVRFELDG